MKIERYDTSISTRRHVKYHHVKPSTTLLIMPSSVVNTMSTLNVIRNLFRHFTLSRPICDNPRRATKVRQMSVIRVTRRHLNATYRRTIYRENIRVTILTMRLTNLTRRSTVTTMNATRRVTISNVRAIRLSRTINRRIGTVTRVTPRVQSLNRRSRQFHNDLFRRPTMFVNMMHTINTRSTRIMTTRPTRIECNGNNVRVHLRTRQVPVNLRMNVVQMTNTISHIIGHVVSHHHTRPLILYRLLRLTLIRLQRNYNILLLQINGRSTTRHTTTMNGTSRTIFNVNMSEPLLCGTLYNRHVRLLRDDVYTLILNRLYVITTSNRYNRDDVYLLRLTRVYNQGILLRDHLFFQLLYGDHYKRHYRHRDRDTRYAPGATRRVIFRSRFLQTCLPPGTTHHPFPTNVFLPFSLHNEHSTGRLSTTPSL